MRVLDLFCGAGGASMGYHWAGHKVTGVDSNKSLRYPFEFVHSDVFSLPSTFFEPFGFIHASPPCQHYSLLKHQAKHTEDSMRWTRRLLESTGKPYVIENVHGSPLRNQVYLCGTMFGHDLYRHRFFEFSKPLQSLVTQSLFPSHPFHQKTGRAAGKFSDPDREIMSVTGRFGNLEHAKYIMQIHWMTRDELAQAIPPYYTECIAVVVSELLSNDLLSTSQPQ